MPNEAGQDRSSADICAVFSQVSKELLGAAQNVSALCRELSLNRTQINGYLAGKSFPWSDTLQQICIHCGRDARSLFQPLSESNTTHPMSRHRTCVSQGWYEMHHWA
jgi:transcriptional regulator with XRE-family HTH domain